MRHFGKACGKAVANFRKARQVRITAEFKHEHNEHEERHEEVQAVKFCDATEHEGNDRNTAIRITELACKKEAGKYVKDACGKGGCIDDGQNPLVIGHVAKRTGRPQVKHHDVNAC